MGSQLRSLDAVGSSGLETIRFLRLDCAATLYLHYGSQKCVAAYISPSDV